jgi:hypothetical protein
MTEPTRPAGQPKFEELELNRVTIQDLTESEAEQAEGGRAVVVATSNCACSICCDAGSNRCL